VRVLLEAAGLLLVLGAMFLVGFEAGVDWQRRQVEREREARMLARAVKRSRLERVEHWRNSL
jgi:hypothetical protein